MLGLHRTNIGCDGGRARDGVTVLWSYRGCDGEVERILLVSHGGQSRTQRVVVVIEEVVVVMKEVPGMVLSAVAGQGRTQRVVVVMENGRDDVGEPWLDRVAHNEWWL